MTRSRSSSPLTLTTCALLITLMAACGGSGSASPTSPTSTTATTTSTTTTTTTTTSSTPLSYDQDLAPIFATDCVSCHRAGNARGGYAMDSYAAVMTMVTPGNASSHLVTSTRSGGSMYRYFSGDAASKSEMVRRWVVENNAAQSR